MLKFDLLPVPAPFKARKARLFTALASTIEGRKGKVQSMQYGILTFAIDCRNAGILATKRRDLRVLRFRC
jgi:hypothetical protein